MAAVFNFISDLRAYWQLPLVPRVKSDPPVVSTAEKPGLDVAQPTRPEAPIDARPVSVAPQIEDTSQGVKLSHVESGGSLKPPVPGDDNSATEESETEDNSMNEDIPKGSQPPPRTSESKPLSRSTSVVRSSPQRPASTKDEPDSDYSPARPAKKLKKPPTASSTDDDSDEESKPRVAQTKGVGGPGGPGGIKRGTRQPIKRGGKRF
ncbi:hypothetical protein H0H87_007650 [Tephrocybe sp. NHM501043]|nr:hypothetical protein H0H87_007650 [Tephrocybe sp. NHM501043]